MCLCSCTYLENRLTGPFGQILRWETLRLDAPSSDEAWNGVVGFRRALADSACLAEFGELLR